MGERAYAYLVGAVVVALVLWPLFRVPPVDSFPLSTYPMFSRNVAADSRTSIVQAMGVRVDGSRFSLPPSTVANDEVLQAHRTLARAVGQGVAATEGLCREIASRVAASDLSRVREVEIATFDYDSVAYFTRSAQPLGFHVHARCSIQPE